MRSTVFFIFRYSQFNYPILGAAMAPRSDDVLKMSERELTVLSSIGFRMKEETSCFVFDCSASTSTSGPQAPQDSEGGKRS